MARKNNRKQPPILDVEVANRLLDPFETHYLGVLRTNDPLLVERGDGGSAAYDIYRDLRRDGKVFAGLQKRKLAVIGRPWQVGPVDERGQKDAEIVTKILARMNFDAACLELMDALLYGFVPAEIIWTVRDGLVVPDRLIAHRQRRFVYQQNDPESPPELRMLVREDMIRGVALPERKFVVHRVNPDDDNPYGTGLGLQLYWPVFFKRKGIVSWNKLNDRFGSPTPHGKYPSDANPKQKSTLFEALRAMSDDGVVMTPQGMDISLLEAKVSGNVTTQQALVEYMDDWIAEVLLGQSPRGKAWGAVAAASIEREQVRIELSQADSDLLSETLNRTLLKWICEYNGLAPCQVYRVIKADEDLKIASETDVNVQSLGFKMSLDGVRAKYGEHWNLPADTAAPQAPPPPADEGRDDGNASFAESDAPMPGDAIDQIVAAELAQWREVVDPLAEPLRALIEQAAAEGLTAGELLARLPGVLAQMDDGPLIEALTRLVYTARLAGNLGGEQVDGR